MSVVLCLKVWEFVCVRVVVLIVCVFVVFVFDMCV